MGLLEKISGSKEQKIFLAFAITSSIVSIQNLLYYLHFDFNLIILLITPYAIFIEKPGRISIRYAIPTIICLVLYPFLKVQTLFYFGYMFFLCFAAESIFGKLNNLPLFLILLFSPFTIFIFETFGFPIRLKLTSSAVSILNFVGIETVAKGNLIGFGKEVFKVDPECMGLQMLTTSFLITIIFISYYARNLKQRLSLVPTALLMIVTLFLIIVNNLFRIVLIIIFKAYPDTFAHEILGILCLIFYVAIPVFFLTKLSYRLFGKQRVASASKQKNKKLLYGLLTTMVLCLLFLNINREKFRNIERDEIHSSLSLPGFSEGLLEKDVYKFINDSTLVYVKPMGNFYGSYHSPLICWKGSGYKFESEEIVSINNTNVYVTQISSDDKKYYTAWWFDNGECKTIKQLDWRFKSLKGENKFKLINVTAETLENLKSESAALLKSDFLKP